MILRRVIVITVYIFSCNNIASADIKNTGTPFIHNFRVNEYRAGTQNWSIAQDTRGFMYFANNDGLLVFNGVKWDLYKMPNMSMVRSTYISDEGEIYVGAYNEFGKMERNRNGKIVFRSLKDNIPPTQETLTMFGIYILLTMKLFSSHIMQFMFIKRGPELRSLNHFQDSPIPLK